MTPAEFKAIRHALGLSAQGLARALGVSDGRTVRRWERGDRGIPGPVKRLMNLLQSGQVMPSELEHGELAIRKAMRNAHEAIAARIMNEPFEL